MIKKKVLVTGGMGYIGSHTVVELLQSGYEAVIADDLSNSKPFILERIEKITKQRPSFYCIDLCSEDLVNEMFSKEAPFDVIIHFAAFKAVGESVQQPLKYFQNNMLSLLNVLNAMKKFNCSNIVFSSSATVYGEPQELPLKETTPLSKALSAYGSTKQMGEEIVEKVAAAGSIQAISLRYFNPVGAHESALIGELPLGTPNNLLPFITQTAAGKQKQLTVFGNDYNTPDGTCIRDYIHVVDLAKAHVASSQRLIKKNKPDPYEVFNIGTGKGVSVMEMIVCFEKESQMKLNYTCGKRRPGDAAAVYADVTKANAILQWKAEKSIEDMIKDAWRWETFLAKEKNPVSTI